MIARPEYAAIALILYFAAAWFVAIGFGRIASQREPRADDQCGEELHERGK